MMGGRGAHQSLPGDRYCPAAAENSVCTFYNRARAGTNAAFIVTSAPAYSRIFVVPNERRRRRRFRNEARSALAMVLALPPGQERTQMQQQAAGTNTDSTCFGDFKDMHNPTICRMPALVVHYECRSIHSCHI
jgi:hypothetical protein